MHSYSSSWLSEGHAIHSMQLGQPHALTMVCDGSRIEVPSVKNNAVLLKLLEMAVVLADKLFQLFESDIGVSGMGKSCWRLVSVWRVVCPRPCCGATGTGPGVVRHRHQGLPYIVYRWIYFGNKCSAPVGGVAG